MKSKNHNPKKSGLYAIRYTLYAPSGFTIVETLIAIAVLMLAIAAPLSMAERALSSAQIARKEVTAFYLAQEAVEYVRNIKDTNAISGLGGTPDWLTGLDICKDAAGCGLDPTSSEANTQVILCSEAVNDNDDCLLYQYTGIDEALLGIFGHRSTTGWTKSPYRRKLSIEVIEADIEARVTATISWGDGTAEGRTIKISSSIFNWYTSP